MRTCLKLALALVLTGAGTAFAHAELASSDPADGAVLAALPAAVTLSFTEPAEVRFSTFKVYPLAATIAPEADEARARLNGLAGQLVSEVLETRDDAQTRADAGVSTAAATSDTVTLPLKAGLGAGSYVVMWRILSVDTHETQGFSTFTVAP